MRLIAVTACPTGIAHTYMAAESLEVAAKARGHEIVVETQGSAGSTPLTAEQLAGAEGAILAADVAVRDRDRFAGIPVVEGPVKRGINGAEAMLDELEAKVAEAPRGAAVSTAAADATTAKSAAGHEPGPGATLRGWLMTGVSYMIPFVAAGGLLIAIAFLIGGPEVASEVNGGTFEGVTYEEITDISAIYAQVGIAGVLFKIGGIAFSMLAPILGGYIAYAMADRQGLVPGIVAGLIANEIGAGFLGGLVGGLLAGAVVLAIGRVPVHKNVRGVMPVVVVPLLSATVVGLAMILLIGGPIADATEAMTGWLEGLGGSNAVLLGLLLGLMMAFDMGGPVNKVAYAFGVASLASGNQTIMAAVIAAGMTPPLALALATRVRPKLWTSEERTAGNAAWLLGASFITEGAIPFAAADPLRVIPSLMAGSATAGAISMGVSAASPAPHGGLWIIALIGSPLLWLLAIVVGTAVSAGALIAAKSIGRRATPVGVEAPAPGAAAAASAPRTAVPA